MEEKYKPNSLYELMMQNQNAMTEEGLGFESEKKYYYHTSLSTAISILNPENSKIGSQFWIRSLSQMNDVNEAERHKKDADRVYALCFSNRNTESIPMWYLYSGITGEGARINITQSRMRDFIKGIKMIFPVSQGEVNYNRPLLINKDFVLEWGWVYYTDFSNKTVYKNNSYKHKEKENTYPYLEHNYFIKDIEWAYEKEFRIVIQLREKTNNNLTQIALPFDKKQMIKGSSGLTVTLAPEAQYADKEELGWKLDLPSKFILDSKMNIKMDLLKRNKMNFLDTFDSFTTDLDDEQRVKMIRMLEKNTLVTHSAGRSLY